MKTLRVLVVEDSADDALLVVDRIRAGGYDVSYQLVQTADAMRQALESRDWDVILSDWRMPQFSAQAALALAQGSGKDVPFIIVSGTIGEETAVAALKGGAHDFLLKGNLARLVPAIERELRDLGVRRDRALAEEGLRRSEERYRRLLADLPVGIYRTAPDGTLLDANSICLEMFGIPDWDVASGINVRRFYVDSKAWEGRRSRADAGTATGSEFRIRRADGTTIWVRDTGRAVRAPDGRVRYYGGVLEDITELRRAQAARERSETLFRALIEQGSELVLLLGADSTIHYASPSVQRVLGYTHTELVGRRALEFIHPDEAAGAKAMLEGVIAQPGVPVVTQQRASHKDGSWRTLEVTARNLLQDSVIQSVVINARDVSDRVRLEEEFRQAQKMEAVGRLAGGVAHDFNNLLTVIDASAAFLMEELGVNDPRRHDVDEIKKAAERAASLTRQLLAFSRRQVFQLRVLDINAVVADMDKMLRRLIGEDVELAIALAPDLRRVRADPGQIEQVILNLTVNARDAMPSGGKLRIETRNAELDPAFCAGHEGLRPGRYVAVAFRDTGQGIASDTQQRIFEPFFTTKAQGTGLGLATVYGIVRQSGGHVAVSSQPGRGATFTLYLPATDAVPEPAGAEEQPLPAARATETVLLVEDEAAVRAVATRALRQAGYAVLESASAAEALELSTRHADRIDVLVTDVVMPRMNGRALADQMASRLPGLKVLYVSGYTDDATLQDRVLESGGAFLEKPFTPDAILRKLRQVLATQAR